MHVGDARINENPILSKTNSMETIVRNTGDIEYVQVYCYHQYDVRVWTV